MTANLRQRNVRFISIQGFTAVPHVHMESGFTLCYCCEGKQVDSKLTFQCGTRSCGLINSGLAVTVLVPVVSMLGTAVLSLAEMGTM